MTARAVSERIHILNIIRFPIGGIRSYLRYTYTKLDPERYKVTVLTIDRPEAALLQTGMWPLDVGLETVSERKALLRLTLAAGRLVQRGAFDLIHSQGTTAAVASDLSTRLSGLPHVITLHETFRAQQFSGALGRLKRRIIESVLNRADRVIVVSRDARANLFEHFHLDGAAERVELIRNGVSVNTLLQEAAQSPHRIRERWGIDSERTLLGFVGRFMPEKGFDVLLDAVRRLARSGKQLPSFRVVAVNDGAFVREYKQQVAEWGLESFFVFSGFQPSAAGTLVELDAVIVPSRREACPLVAMEAMVLGCPLIASDCIGLRELTDGSPSLQCVAGDASSLASAIERFLANKAIIQTRAREYVSTARGAFESSRTAEALAGAFMAALAIPPKPAVRIAR